MKYPYISELLPAAVLCVETVLSEFKQFLELSLYKNENTFDKIEVKLLFISSFELITYGQ